ncbi:Uu.00g034760.m01.CDS01 [Anthostomella pinea]|uniref:Uu.00g034760.m01.CDS01 n=1 Tax=Anthostomella pinea TaxID=933095 RepID=A0AAI8V972_9PEZI|nr:Uu.00g034760.m01.CDS01 [Anthostomella pinea]
MFQVVFNYRMGATRTPSMDGLDMRFHNYADAKTPYDLTVSVDEMDDGSGMLTFTTQSNLYDQEGTELLVDTYKHFLQLFAEDTTSSIEEVPQFHASQLAQAVELGSGPAATSGSLETLAGQIDSWLVRDPSAIAIKDVNHRSMSYDQMSIRANDIVAGLIGAGAVVGSRVCVLLTPALDTICSILAILRVGAVYIPLDIRSTDARLGDIQEESNPDILLFHPDTAERAVKLKGRGCTLVDLSAVLKSNAKGLPPASGLDDVAMILYTSGSTGKPKGIPLTNRNIRSPISGMNRRLKLGREVVLQQSGQGFDAAIFQIFIALANGGTIVMGDNQGAPADLADLIERERVTFTLFIVSEMQSVFKCGFEALRRASAWRTALCGGEAFTTNLAEKFQSLGHTQLRLWNAYGPTKGSIISSCAEVQYSEIDKDQDFRVSIGRPLADYAMYIVDAKREPVPVGFPGELAICGPAVANGYLNRTDLTATKFRSDTISVRSTGQLSVGGQLYLTGDKGRLLQDGTFVILGRIDGDSQVKIRGQRVVLDGLSNAVLRASDGDLADATVIVRGEDAENQLLVAYVVFDKAATVKDEAQYLRRLLRRLPLPSTMRPTLAVPLPSLPFTDRGKLDTRALAKMPLPALSADEDMPEEKLTETENRLKAVWRGVLGEAGASVPIYRESDFFSVGGNSLLLLRLRAEIRREFGIAIPVAELFQATILRSLAARLTGDHNSDEPRLGLNQFLSSLPAQPDSKGRRSCDSSSLGLKLAVSTAPQSDETPDGNPEKLKVESPKIVCYTGDLSLPMLEMSEQQIAEVVREVDVIIHNGAEELASLALHCNIPIHYISTGGVALLSGLDEQPEESLRSTPPPTDGAYGYIASKWASEVLLEKLHDRSGLQVSIHRPSNVTGDDVPAKDIVHSVIRMSKLMRTVPDLTGSRGSFDFIHVETIARNICDAAISSAASRSRSSLSFVHQSGETVVPIHDLKKHLEDSARDPFSTVHMAAWVEAAKEKGLNDLIASYLLATKGVINMPLLRVCRGE